MLEISKESKKQIKIELFNDHFQNFKRYAIPKAQLVIADIPYNLGVNAYASSNEWYIDGDNKNGESKKAGKAFFDTDNDFRIAEYMHFCSKLLIKEPKEVNKAPCMIIFCSFQQMQMVIEYAEKYGFKKYIPLVFIKNSSAQVLKANMKIVGATEIDILTYSFPCTDLSKAGKQKGLNNTRSGLVYEVLRILHELEQINRLPTILIMENVIDLIQVKFIRQFQQIQTELEELGYKNYTQVLNAKDYGVAQTRTRVFMVSILGEYSYNFPKPIKLNKKLKDYLEENVDKKYYITEKLYKYLTDMKDRNGFIRGERFKPISENDIAYTLTTRTNNRVTDNFIKIDTEIKMENGRMNIRKLTPKECWRLMDINDTYFEKARQVNSNTQLYKQAGNGIVIAVLEAIFRQMIEKGCENVKNSY